MHDDDTPTPPLTFSLSNLLMMIRIRVTRIFKKKSDKSPRGG